VTKLRKVGAWIAALIAIAIVTGVLFFFLRRSRQASVLQVADASAKCLPMSCHTLKCAVGTHPRMDADLCCRECEPNAPTLAINERCAQEKCNPCAEGTRAEPIEGQCCPRCVPLQDEACKKGKALYDARRSALEPELRACSADDDCMVASFGDACSASCPMPLNKQGLGPVVSLLREEADVYCNACPTPMFACQYPDATEASCLKGRCQFKLSNP
jgi:hypothetical protein